MSRTFLVTGASKGIGLALSQRLARTGHQVVGIARKAIADFLGEMIAVDLAEDAATDAALRDLAARFTFDGIVNRSPPEASRSCCGWLTGSGCRRRTAARS